MTTFKTIKNKFIFFLTYLYISSTSLVFADDPPTDTANDSNALQFKTSKESQLDGLQNISPQSFMAGAIILALNISIITFFFMLLIGGYRWITSSGDEKKLTLAKNQITHGFIGLVVILSAWLIMGVIGTLFDIDIFKWTIPTFGSPQN